MCLSLIQMKPRPTCKCNRSHGLWWWSASTWKTVPLRKQEIKEHHHRLAKTCRISCYIFPHQTSDMWINLNHVWLTEYRSSSCNGKYTLIEVIMVNWLKYLIVSPTGTPCAWQHKHAACLYFCVHKCMFKSSEVILCHARCLHTSFRIILVFYESLQTCEFQHCGLLPCQRLCNSQ